jgi:hypothetical protein
VLALADCRVFVVRKETIIDTCGPEVARAVEGRLRKLLKNGFVRGEGRL